MYSLKHGKVKTMHPFLLLFVSVQEST